MYLENVINFLIVILFHEIKVYIYKLLLGIVIIFMYLW